MNSQKCLKQWYLMLAKVIARRFVFVFQEMYHDNKMEKNIQLLKK